MTAEPAGPPAPLARAFCWSMLAVLGAFLIDNYLTLWRGWPGARAALGPDAPPEAWTQAGLYALGLAAACLHAFRSRATGLRADARRIAALNAWLIRGAFWAVLLVGLADAAVSFLRVEGLLEGAVGPELAAALGKSTLRGAWLHWPLVAVGFLLATVTRTLGFHWLALLVVAAELVIVIARFVFSYEQAFMADLVRFWYGALFLFASAHTLLEDGHVRVDVFYSAFGRRAKGRVNAIGAVLLGMTLCWVILAIGMGGKSNVINGPLLVFEVTQAGFGLYVKYFMAGFLGVFAISMLIQFAAAFLDAMADMREPEPADAAAAPTGG